MTGDVIDLKANVAGCEAFNQMFGPLLGTLSQDAALHSLLEHNPYPGLGRHRAAGARWITRRGIDADPDRIIVCNGGQEALMAALSTVVRPNDTVLTEQLNYAGVQFLADLLHFRLHGVEVDEFGLVPDALESACREEQVAAIFVNPTNHNPTNAFAPLERRKAVLEIAERAGAFIIEDDVFGHLTGDDTATLSAMAPDRCVYLCSLSKSIASGLRVGYVLPPAALASRILDSFRRMYWTSPAMMGEFATRLIEEGHADEIISWRRHDARARFRLARETIGLEGGADLPSYHLWLPLPEPGHAKAFAADLQAQGARVAPSDQFAVDHSPVPQGIRLALGAARDQGQLKEGLNIVAKALKNRLDKSYAKS